MQQHKEGVLGSMRALSKGPYACTSFLITMTHHCDACNVDQGARHLLEQINSMHILGSCVAADHQTSDIWHSTKKTCGAPSSSFEKAQLLLSRQPLCLPTAQLLCPLEARHLQHISTFALQLPTASQLSMLSQQLNFLNINGRD